MKELLERLPPGLRLSGPVVVSAVAVGVSATFVFYGVRSLIEAGTRSSVSTDAADPLAPLATESTQFLETSRKRFEGRSMYSLPTPPPRKPKPVERPKPVEPPPDPGPPPPPATYTGPAPSSVFGDYVLFSTLSESDKRIKVGETKAGITVISVNAPYSVKLGYQRGEYVVEMWPRINESLLRGGLPAMRVPGLTEGTAAGAPGSVQGPAVPAGSTPAGVGAPSVGGAPRPAGAPEGTGTPVTPVPAGGGAAPLAPAAGEPQSGLPSPAMAPQRLPTPPSDPEAPQGESPAGVDYVDRSLLPAPLTDEQIAAMSVPVAQRALRAIEATAGWNIDDHSQARLNHERDMLRARIARGD